jgi:hypothetical protein
MNNPALIGEIVFVFTIAGFRNLSGICQLLQVGNKRGIQIVRSHF